MSKTDQVRKRTKRSDETMARYMDAAEDLYIRLGYEGTSIRAIAKRSKTNLSTVVYHWGTKEELFRSVFLRRFEKIEENKVKMLRSLQNEEGKTNICRLRLAIEAMVFPGFNLIEDPKIALITQKLYGRVLTDPSPVVHKVSQEIFDEVIELWRQLVRECIPGVANDEFFWKYACASGAMIFAQSFSLRIADANRIRFEEVNWDAAPNRVVDFVLGGLLSGNDYGSNRDGIPSLQ